MSFFDGAKTVTFAGKAVSKLELDGKKIWEAVTYKNWVQYSTEADGVTIYNGGLGYKDGYRIRSGGAEAESGNVTTITGYIPFKQGDILRIYPAFIGCNTENTINFFDAAFTNLGQYTDIGVVYGICGNGSAWKSIETARDGVSVVDISGVTNGGEIAYVRIGNYIHADESVITSGSEMIITKNEEIPL